MALAYGLHVMRGGARVRGNERALSFLQIALCFVMTEFSSPPLGFRKYHQHKSEQSS